MMLDNFFTLTEINNGLTNPSRVEELVAVMQKDTYSSVGNVSEATRQWSVVATAIAATENQDCLDVFIQLDGLQFISKWLKDAQKLSNEAGDSFLEESIILLLQALGKLHADYERLVADEIWTTVEDLLVHKSLKVKSKAQMLFETWKKKRNGYEYLSNVEKFGALTDVDVVKSANIGRHSESPQKDDSLSRETSCEEIGNEPTREDHVDACSDVVDPGPAEKTLSSDKASVPSVVDGAPSGNSRSHSLPNPTMELPLCHSQVESCNPFISREDTLDVQMEFNELESAGKLNDTPKIESSADKSGSLEEFGISEYKICPASSDAGDVTKSVTESSSRNLYVAGNKSSSNEYIDSRKSEYDGKCSMDDCGSADKCMISRGEHHKLCKSSSIEKSWENTEEFGALRSGIEDHGKITKLDLHVSDNLANDYKFTKFGTRGESDRARKKFDVELYGIIDPLEVARQVAIEVEREIVGYIEKSYSSEKLLESREQQRGSLNKSTSSEGPPVDVPNDTENPDDEISGSQDMETSQVTEAAQEEDNPWREPFNFDLNQEVCLEDADRYANQFIGSASIVSASRARAPRGLAVAPLQFEGNLGWKGSAATSAFRPASLRKLPESERDLSTVGSCSYSKQQPRYIDINLNVAETLDGRTGNLSPNKNIPLYTGLPFGNSSVETNARRFEHIDLDLNLSSQDGSDWRMGQFFPQANGHQDRSRSLSSSSKLPFFKNIDLNDQPSFLKDSSDNSDLNKSSQNFNVYGGKKSDDSAISIMGTRVEISNKDLVPPLPVFPNGRTSQLAFGANLARTGNIFGMGSVLPYAHSSVYGYKNLALGPTIPFSSTIYGSGGSFPYMMDSRGAPVVPQNTGSFSQTPFFINMEGPTNGVGAVVPSQSSSDLNSKIMVEGESRETPGFFLNSGQVRSMEDHLMSTAQPAISSVVSGKRKEHDNGWEQYPFKYCTPPWK